MVCFCYRRRFVAPPQLSADGKFIRRPAAGCYQDCCPVDGVAHSFPSKNNAGFSNRALHCLAALRYPA